MKKKIIYIILSSVIIFFSIYITTKHLTSQEYQLTFNFNHLNNNQIVDQTKVLLLDNKVPKDNINLWLECVKKYNLKNDKYIQNTSDGWCKLNLTNYNKIDFNETLNECTEEYDSFDLNCRISSFILLKDMISSDYFLRKYDHSIEKEIIQMKNIFDGKITNEEITTFRSLFSPITFDIDSLKDVNIYDESLKNLKNYWKKEHLIFKSNNPSLIQVVLIESKNNNVSVVVGHTGLLIESNNDVYFIEKKNPCFPYQVSKFKDYNDLNKYIITQFKDTENYNLMILQNDNIIFRK
ncbi:DUF4300 family protein [Paraclostridium bifermentans]|uniref:DUF4300 family protein n=1 Tax=Paraclostridium bifermentans TaxID=1490 RepID=UPI00214A82D9|nr:DUF4300 family protein [Paraclostridium bifermentans]MCR1877186.1 DUF4300 family protein [Paraclostridium bifermentans]